MQIKLQIAVTLICILIMVYFINLIRKNKVELKYIFLWILADIAVLLLCYMPKTLKRIASLLDIYEPLHLVIFIGFIFMGLLFINMSIMLNDNIKKTVSLSQKIALLEDELKNKSDKAEN